MKTDDISGRALVEETERFPGWLTWIMMLPIILVVGLSVFIGASVNSNDTWLIIILVIPIQMVSVFYFRKARLEKTVTENGLYFRWKPLQKKFRYIDKDDIDAFRVMKSPLLKLGSGYFPGIGRYHNLSNGNGIQIRLRNGKKIFFGTHEEMMFWSAMEKISTPFEPALNRS